MKLLGRDIPARELLARLEERLKARGLGPSQPTGARAEDEGVEPRVDPLSFNLAALEENADATRGLPLETHRGGAGRAVLLAKWAFRRAGQVFINEALGRQRVFNGLVRDSYAQLAAEVLRLREEVARLKAERDAALGAARGRAETPAAAAPAATATAERARRSAPRKVAARGPGGRQPAAQQPTAQQPTARKRAAQRPPPQQPAAKQPAAKRPAAAKRAARPKQPRPRS